MSQLWDILHKWVKNGVGGGGGEEIFLKYGIYFEYRMQALLNSIFYVFHIDFWG